MHLMAQVMAMSEIVNMNNPSSTKNIRSKSCPSTRKKKEICPECKEEHDNTNHLYCTKQCAKDAGVL